MSDLSQAQDRREKGTRKLLEQLETKPEQVVTAEQLAKRLTSIHELITREILGLPWLFTSSFKPSVVETYNDVSSQNGISVQIYMPQVMGGLGPEIPIVEFTRFASTPSNYMSNAWLVCSELIRNKIAVQVELELMRREIAQLRERMRELSSFTHLSFKAVTDRVREADIKVPTHSELIKNAAQWIADKKRREEQIQQTKGSDSSVAQWIADKKRREEQTQQTEGSGSSVAKTALSSTAYYEDDGVGEPEEHATQSTKPGDTTLPFEG